MIRRFNYPISSLVCVLAAGLLTGTACTKNEGRPPSEFHDNAIDSTQMGLEEAAKALREAIQAQPFSIQAKAIKIAAKNGEVVLTGNAATPEEEAKILALAKAHSPHIRDDIQVVGKIK